MRRELEKRNKRGGSTEVVEARDEKLGDGHDDERAVEVEAAAAALGKRRVVADEPALHDMPVHLAHTRSGRYFYMKK